MTLLGFETSGKTASVALCREDELIAQTSVLTKLTHSQSILPIAKELVRHAGISLEEIDGIAVSDGPGSYTGLRIGISAAKALAFGLDKPCAGISTLEGLAYNLLGFDGTICPVMLARQDLLYSAMFSCDNGKIKRLCDDEIISIEDLKERLKGITGKIMLAGDYAKVFFENAGMDKLSVAPPHLRLQNAAGICFAAFSNGLSAPENLNARYLQPTKAEKDFLAGNLKVVI